MKQSIAAIMLLIAGASHQAFAQAAFPGSLRVGAAKLDVPHAQGELPN
jgi:hypothetical protein